jgi:hypothetical protein
MDGFADASAGCLDADETYGFHLDFSFVQIEEGWKSIKK